MSPGLQTQAAAARENHPPMPALAAPQTRAELIFRGYRSDPGRDYSVPFVLKHSVAKILTQS